MTLINREIGFTHDGKEYSVVASNRVIMKIDSSLRKLSGVGFMGTLGQMHVASQAAQADPSSAAAMDMPVFGLAHIIASLMSEAGAEVSEDDIYSSIMLDFGEAGGGATMAILEELFKVVTPPEKAKAEGDAGKNS